ncbi:MAG: apolipoprotein N-acyltransferase [Candidatus Omnitrophota bacterium]|nr:apolipoprotein N-acyltransferase [Candidatus Omnitrophota bacterium]
MKNTSNAYKAIILSLFSSLLLILSFPRADLGFLAWVGLLPLFFAIRGKSPIFSFLISYLCGFLFFLGTIYWLIHVTLLGWIVLCLYLALYFGLFGFLFSRFSKLPKILFFFFIPCAWTLLEYLRAHLLTGFGWALLGYSQYKFLPIIQIADIAGAYGISFLVIMVNLAIYLRLRERKESRAEIMICSFLIILTFTYGFFRLNQKPGVERIKISVIQGNIPQEWKWEEGKKDFNLEKYLFLAKLAALENPDLIIWPETAFPGYLWQEPELFAKVLKLTREIKIPLLVGLVTSDGASIYNSAILISKDGEPAQIYNKLHLVPFGEYIPLRKVLPFLETIVPIGDFTAGKEYTVFKTPAPFSTLICFEDTVAELSCQFTKRGAEFLTNITNDAWFKDTAAPYQHLQASVMRAVENRRPLIRAANTGVSAFIAANGEIVDRVQQSGKDTFVDGILSSEITTGNELTFYTRFGDIFIVFCCLVVLAGIFKKKNS